MTAGDQVELVEDQIISLPANAPWWRCRFCHACQPRLSPFPNPSPTYADLSVPASPGELLERIGEIGRVVYRASAIPSREVAIALCATTTPSLKPECI